MRKMVIDRWQRPTGSYARERKCLLRWVVRVNLAGHKWQHLVWGNEGMLPLKQL